MLPKLHHRGMKLLPRAVQLTPVAREQALLAVAPILVRLAETTGTGGLALSSHPITFHGSQPVAFVQNELPQLPAGLTEPRRLYFLS